MADGDWSQLGVPPEEVGEWRALGADAFTAALAIGDGYGPSSARHALKGIRAVASGWRSAGVSETEAIAWHRAGFSALEAAEWSARGTPLEEAALAAGHRMVG